MGRRMGVVGRVSAARMAESSSKGGTVNCCVQPDAAVQCEYARSAVVTAAQPRCIWHSPSGAQAKGLWSGQTASEAP